MYSTGGLDASGNFKNKEDTASHHHHPLLKEMLFKEEQPEMVHSPSSSAAASPGGPTTAADYETISTSPLRELLCKSKNLETTASSVKTERLPSESRKSDHQLLREVLRDTSFQRKYNLKPVDLGAVGTGYVEDMESGECVGDLAREQIEPVLSLAIQQLQKDFDNTCVALGIHPGEFIFFFIVAINIVSYQRKKEKKIFHWVLYYLLVASPSLYERARARSCMQMRYTYHLCKIGDIARVAYIQHSSIIVFVYSDFNALCSYSQQPTMAAQRERANNKICYDLNNDFSFTLFRWVLDSHNIV